MLPWTIKFVPILAGRVFEVINRIAKPVLFLWHFKSNYCEVNPILYHTQFFTKLINGFYFTVTTSIKIEMINIDTKCHPCLMSEFQIP